MVPWGAVTQETAAAAASGRCSTVYCTDRVHAAGGNSTSWKDGRFTGSPFLVLIAAGVSIHGQPYLLPPLGAASVGCSWDVSR